MKITKILALFLASLLALTLLASCNKEEETTSKPEGSESEQTTESGKQNEDEISERFDYNSADMNEYVKLEGYDSLTVEVDEEFEINDSAIQRYIDRLCEAYPAKLTDKPVEAGDTVSIYYEGYKDGVAFSGGSNMNSTAHELKIGSGEFIPGFEEALVGVIPSETSRDNLAEFDITFPEDYDNSQLAGQAVVFKYYIEFSTNPAYPSEYTEEFITDRLLFEPEGEDIKGEFEAECLSYITANSRAATENAVWEALLEAAEFIKLPEAEVEYYVNSYIEYYESEMSYFTTYLGYSFADLDEFVCRYQGYESGYDWRGEVRAESERGVKQNLIFHYIAQKENITVTDEDYKAALQLYLEDYQSIGYNITADQLEEYLGKAMITEQALLTNVTNRIIESTTVNYVDLTAE